MKYPSNSNRLFDVPEIDQARRMHLEGAAESLRLAVIASCDCEPGGRLVSAYWVMKRPRSQTPRAQAFALAYGEDAMTETHINKCVWPWRFGMAPTTMRAKLVEMAAIYAARAERDNGTLIGFR